MRSTDYPCLAYPHHPSSVLTQISAWRPAGYPAPSPTRETDWVTTLPGLSPIFPGGWLTTKDPLTMPRGASRIDPEVSPFSFSTVSQDGVWSGGAVLPVTFSTTPGVVTPRMPDVDSNIRLVWVIWKDNKLVFHSIKLIDYTCTISFMQLQTFNEALKSW